VLTRTVTIKCKQSNSKQLNTSFPTNIAVEDECRLGTAQCDANAQCADTPESYTCTCRDGWRDVTAEQNVTGRKCEQC
jgi:hypothetical protein